MTLTILPASRAQGIALTFLFALSACREAPTPSSTGAAPDTGGIAVVALTQNIDFANGLLSAEIYSQEINSTALFLPLLRYDEKLQLAPMLARSWQMSGDTSVVLQLRNDVHWHDGVKTSAYDVEFTYRYGSNPDTGYPNADYWVGWNGVQVLDSFTVRFSFTPQPEPLANLPWIPVMPRHLLEQIKPAELRNAPFNQKPVGNGPFRFVEYVPNDRWVFEANRDYPADLGGRPLLNRLVFRVIPDQTAQESELLTGNVDFITSVRPERVAELAAKPGVYRLEKPGRQFAFIAWNTKRPPLDDARVRRALTMAIDRERMVQVVARGIGQVAAGPVPPFHWSYDSTIQPLPHSVDSARALLAAAGIRDRNGDGIAELPNGKQFREELKIGSNNQLNSDIGELIRSDLAAAGVRIVTRPTEFNTMVGDITSPERKFDAFLLAWQTDFRLVLHDMFHSRAINNPFQFASYRNAVVDTLLDKLESTTSREVATPLWRRLQTVMRDEQPWTFLYYYSTVYAARERLQGVDMDIRGAFVNLPKWYVRK
jgi:peptide/nickel transport system substrate-binding protein